MFKDMKMVGIELYAVFANKERIIENSKLKNDKTIGFYLDTKIEHKSYPVVGFINEKPVIVSSDNKSIEIIDINKDNYIGMFTLHQINNNTCHNKIQEYKAKIGY